jgi:hypothetical protein
LNSFSSSSLLLFLPSLQKPEPEFGFSKNVHSPQVPDHLQADGQGDGSSQLAQKLIEHGIASSLDALQLRKYSCFNIFH